MSMIFAEDNKEVIASSGIKVNDPLVAVTAVDKTVIIEMQDYDNKISITFTRDEFLEFIQRAKRVLL